MPRLPALSPKEAGSVQKDPGIYTDNIGGTLTDSGHCKSKIAFCSVGRLIKPRISNFDLL
jgi:hypothetical protein